jgi:hypothetical protein
MSERVNEITLTIRDLGDGQTVEVITKTATPPPTDPCEATEAEWLASIAMQTIQREAKAPKISTATDSTH